MIAWLLQSVNRKTTNLVSVIIKDVQAAEQLKYAVYCPGQDGVVHMYEESQ